MPGNATEPSHGHPDLDAYVELLAEKENLQRAIHDWKISQAFLCLEAEREHEASEIALLARVETAERHFHKLIVLAGIVLAALAVAHVWRSL